MSESRKCIMFSKGSSEWSNLIFVPSILTSKHVSYKYISTIPICSCSFRPSNLHPIVWYLHRSYPHSYHFCPKLASSIPQTPFMIAPRKCRIVKLRSFKTGVSIYRCERLVFLVLRSELWLPVKLLVLISRLK